MKAITAEWVKKAEGDFATMERESRARKNPNYDAVCFHGQQCVEKYLKARLCAAGIAFPKTHDLPALLNMVITEEPIWEAYRKDFSFLTDFGASFRYPGESADKNMANEVLKICRRFRKIARSSAWFK